MSQNIPSPTVATRVAADIMTRQVVSVTPTATVRDVARLLLAHRISAVPVLDTDGAPVGMVSEGDLLGRSDTDRLAGRDWWLALLAGPDAATPAVTGAAAARPVSEVMHAPVVTIEADAPVAAVAEALSAHGIKRLPVMRNGQMVGIVSRADLLAVVASLPAPAPPATHRSGLAGLFLDLIGNAAHLAPAHAGPAPETTDSKAGQQPPAAPAASAFRALVAASDQSRQDAKQQAARTAELERLRQVKALLQLHLDTEMWGSLLAHARDAAAHGAEEMLLLRFPSELCSDGGRKIGVPETGWETTLRGEPADLYDRWARELKPHGFGLAARILDFPGGKPGDIGLFLTWGA
jgi:CBS domain-containing protein